MDRTISIVIYVDGAKDAAAQVRQIRSALDDLGGAQSLQQIVRQSRDVSQAMKELGASFDFTHRQKEMLAGLDDFFRRITAGARSAGDVFKNIWREVADSFERQLRQMASSAGGFGGMLPLSGGSLALGGLGLFGLSMGVSNPVLRGLGSAAGGALSGFSIGGPLGAVIGGLVGGIASLFGKNKKKEHDADIANRGFAELKQILDDYNHFRRDFASSVDASNRIWSEMTSDRKSVV